MLLTNMKNALMLHYVCVCAYAYSMDLNALWLRNGRICSERKYLFRQDQMAFASIRFYFYFYFFFVLLFRFNLFCYASTRDVLFMLWLRNGKTCSMVVYVIFHKKTIFDCFRFVNVDPVLRSIPKCLAYFTPLAFHLYEINIHKFINKENRLQHFRRKVVYKHLSVCSAPLLFGLSIQIL